MTQTVLHVVFTISGGGSLGQALRKAGHDYRLVGLAENLSYGPINPVDLALRAKWIEDELGEPPWRDDDDSFERVWNTALVSKNRKIAWLTRRSAREYAGFLHWLWQLGDAPCEIVDLSEVEISRLATDGSPQTGLAMSLGLLNPGVIYRNRLWDLAKPLENAARERYRDLWQQLLSENTALRVTDGNTLMSVPISFYDSMILSYVTDDWEKAWMVLGNAMVHGMDDSILGPDDIFLRGRMIALANSGHLEIRGDRSHELRDSRVRLARAK